MKPAAGNSDVPPSGLSRDQVLADREAKRLAKQNAKKNKLEPVVPKENIEPVVKDVAGEKKSREEVHAQRAAKKQNKQTKDSEKSIKKEGDVKDKQPDGQSEGKSKAQLRAERRAVQEAQRAKKADSSTAAEVKVQEPKKAQSADSKRAKSPKAVESVTARRTPAGDGPRRVKLFAHLYAQKEKASGVLTGIEDVHSSIARLGAQYKGRAICGSNARVLALLHSLTQVISDYKTPSKEEFSRGLEAEISRCMTFLHRCRPVSVSMSNAVRHIKQQVTQIKLPETEAKAELLDWIDTYIKDQLDKAAEAISIFVRGKISDGDVILTYSCSSLVQKILIAAAREGIKFRVIVVDGRPWLEGREMLRRLLVAGIQCSYVLVNAVSFVMSEVTKILLGAHALLANGFVMSRAGSSQISLLGRTHNVPVLVCCETHKFSERVQTDSFVHNELGNPDDLLASGDSKTEIKSIPPSLTPLNLAYDVTPPDLVSAVVTELAILPCTSVPVILRIK